MPLSCAARIAKLRPFVAHFHHRSVIEKFSDTLHVPFHRIIETNTYRVADLVLAESMFGIKTLTRLFGVPESKTGITYCGVNMDEFSPRIGPRAGDFALLSVGRLEKRKSFDILLRAAALLRQHRGTHFSLTIVGDGPERAHLGRLAENLGIESVISFPGFVSNQDLISLYRNADIFVFPSILEGFGIVLIEAMACGLPIVGSNSTATPEVVNGAGVLVEPGDPIGLAGAIETLWDSTELRNELTGRGLVRVRRLFTWDEVAARVLSAYRLAIRRRDST
jgi:glycosyltransferase involved in cell wall biosynthesis